MSANPIAQGLALGYSAQQLLQFVSRAFPSITPRIKKAQQAGHSVDDILKFISKTMQGSEFSDNMTESQIHGANDKRNEAITKGALKIGTSALAIPAIVRSTVGQGILGQLGLTPAAGPNLSQQPLAQTAANAQGGIQQVAAQTIQPVQQTSGLPPQQQIGMPTAQANPTPPLIPQTHASSSSQTPNVNSGSIIKEMGLDSKIKNLLSAGNKEETIIHSVNSLLTPPQKKWLDDKIKRGEAKPLHEMVQDYLRQASTEIIDNITPEQKQFASESVLKGEDKPLKQLLEEHAKKTLTPTKPEKGQIATTPDGISGEVKSIRGDHALIEDEGKLHKVKAQDLESTPEDVIEEVKSLLKIPEVDRSSVVSLFTYDPEDNEMYIQYHNGETYKYKDVDPEKINILANKMGIPITKGKNIFGAWSPEDKKSLGAALIKEIIKDPKYSKEKEDETWRKLGTYYDYWKGLRTPPKRKKQ